MGAENINRLSGAPRGLLLDDGQMAMATDLYQLTMMAAYMTWDMEEEAAFELFVRSVPSVRGYLIAAGLEQCLHYLEGARFGGDDIDYLRSHPVFARVAPSFFERLRDWKFSGSVWAVEEGTPIFGNEPILQIRAPLFEAQLVETYLLSVINFQTSIASKAARITTAAQGRDCIDFGTRRAHGPQAGVYAARAAYIGGVKATSNVLAGKLCQIPIAGTAAHAFTMACPNEEEAFARYASTFPDHTTLLIDTYDTRRGASRAASIQGHLSGVRIDSGDFVSLSKDVRKILDDAGRTDALITLSGDLNEFKIQALIEAGASVDRFGVGTELVTSKDHPALGGVYKLVSRLDKGQRKDAIKLAEGKLTYPGIKQVWRTTGDNGRFSHDTIQLAHTPAPTPNAAPLLVPVIESGRRIYDCPPMHALQARCCAQLAALPPDLLPLTNFGSYSVQIGDDISALVDQLRAEHAKGT